MSKAPKMVTELVAEFQSQGYDLNQSKSLAWAEYFEEQMAILDQKTANRNLFFGPEIRIDCYCHTCKQGANLLPDTTRLFIQSHKGHETKTFKVR